MGYAQKGQKNFRFQRYANEWVNERKAPLICNLLHFAHNVVTFHWFGWSNQ